MNSSRVNLMYAYYKGNFMVVLIFIYNSRFRICMLSVRFTVQKIWLIIVSLSGEGHKLKTLRLRDFAHFPQLSCLWDANTFLLLVTFSSIHCMLRMGDHVQEANLGL
jgi:hypothetical protein